MENNYAEKTGDGTIAIHADMIIAERIYEGICKIHSEYPYPCPVNWKDERKKLAKIKREIEKLLPEQQHVG